MSELKKELDGSELANVTGGDMGGDPEDMTMCLRCCSKDITVTGAGTANELHICKKCGWKWHNLSDYALG